MVHAAWMRTVRSESMLPICMRSLNTVVIDQHLQRSHQHGLSVGGMETTELWEQSVEESSRTADGLFAVLRCKKTLFMPCYKRVFVFSLNTTDGFTNLTLFLRCLWPKWVMQKRINACKPAVSEVWSQSPVIHSPFMNANRLLPGQRLTHVRKNFMKNISKHNWRNNNIYNRWWTKSDLIKNLLSMF